MTDNGHQVMRNAIQ